MTLLNETTDRRSFGQSAAGAIPPETAPANCGGRAEQSRSPHFYTPSPAHTGVVAAPLPSSQRCGGTNELQREVWALVASELRRDGHPKAAAYAEARCRAATCAMMAGELHG